MTTYEKGQKVICNGYPGVITEVCHGVLAGMYNVKLWSGCVCVSPDHFEPKNDTKS